ncbi:MAG TPA: carboxypeptidase regulatory-like domain-containing protein [Armatimonadota bacterium]|nr:carboxypeptidase regulatory-like domain-containing protein [Armatimonadota bacterium]
MFDRHVLISHFRLVVLLALILFISSVAAEAVSITYGPLAWPQDPPGGGYPTSVKVIWWTDTATSTNTAYVGASPSGPWDFTGTDSNDSSRHEALVTGLTGNTVYYVYVTSSGVDSSVVQFRTGLNELINGSLETWHAVSGQGWGTEEPDGWHGWEIYPWTPPGFHNADHISIMKDKPSNAPTPLVKDGSHRVGMDEGWRSCYGGIYQEVAGLSPGAYTVSGWAAWFFNGVSSPEKHIVQVLAKDGPHTPGAVPTGQAIFSQDATVSDKNWKYVQGSVECTTGTVTIYANLRSDDWDGASYAHFDAFRVMAETAPAVSFDNFQASRVINGSSYDVTISYDTDIATTTQVEWGPTSSYGNTSPLDSNLVTHHVVSLAGVAPGTAAYHYRALATAPGGIDACSRDQTFDAPQVILSDISSSVDYQTGTVCTIRWDTNYATTTNKVLYRALGSGSYTEVIEADSTPHTSHLVALTGLSLGTIYEFHVSSGSADIITVTSSPDGTFETPDQPGPPNMFLGMAMTGHSLPEGGDDIGVASEVKRMVQVDSPMVNYAGLSAYNWPQCQPDDPGDGPNVYDWSAGDATNADRIPGKSRQAYFQVYGNTPLWLTLDTPRYWEKFEQFIEAMIVHMNQLYGDVDIIFENEPNDSRKPPEFPGDWADWYIHCLQHFYVAVHRADAQTGGTNRVIAGNLAGHQAQSFEALYAKGLKNYSNVLGYHAYPYDIRDGVEVADLAKIHGIQVDYGDGGKKIYVGEGWGSGRSAGFDRSSPTIEPPCEEVENMWLAMAVGWDNVMTPRTNWDFSYLYGMRFFCGNDNWGAMNWRRRAIPKKDESGNITGFIVDGYSMTPDIAPQFWNGGMMDWYGNSKDCLIHVFPGNGLVFMNPGFELTSSPPKSHLPHFWTTSAEPAPTANYAVDDAIFRGGSRSLKLTRTTPGSDGAYQLTAKRSALPAVSYRARVWCKTQGVSGQGARFCMRFSNLDGSQKSSLYWAADLTGTADWRQMEVVATAPLYASRIETGCYVDGVGTAWFDDVTIAMADQSLVGTIRGYTLDEGQIPVPDSIVRTTTGGYQTISDAEGYYEIENVAAGTYDLVCRKVGCVPHRVKNQTVAPEKLTFVSFNMRMPKPGLTVTEVTCDRETTTPTDPPINVAVTVSNSKPYPVIVSDVGVFVEKGGHDATGKFSILASPSNPKTIPASADCQFNFTMAPLSLAEGDIFSVNAYAFGQEDRPNLLTNGNFDLDNDFTHWGFWSGASTSQPVLDTSDFNSAPNALRWYVTDTNGDKFSWAGNYSAYVASAPAASSHQKYIVGAHHKDVTTGSVSMLLFIEEYYYDAGTWLYNGRRHSTIAHRSVWTGDCMIYETGDPDVTPGLYSTNRLKVSVGSWIGGKNYSSTNWWDDVYLKEEGDWLADDRATTGASLVVGKPVSSLSAAFAEAAGTYVRVSGPIVTAGSESFTSRFYVEQENRAIGSLVVRASGPSPEKGTRVEVTGKVGQLDGERALLDSVMKALEAADVPDPLGMITRSAGPAHLKTQGLLVTIWGRVTYVAADDSHFVVSDGSDVDDGAGPPGIKVICTGTVEGITPPAQETFVQVTGISGCEQNGALPVLRPRSDADIAEYLPL